MHKNARRVAHLRNAPLEALATPKIAGVTARLLGPAPILPEKGTIRWTSL
jgi:hypothetical protein